MPTYGTATRAFHRLQVLRGFTGNEPQSLSYSAVPKAGEAILSGMVISLDSNGQWVKGAAAGKHPYVAYHDQADLTVVSSGKLLGLSCTGDYVFQTAFFATEGTFADGTPLLADTARTAVTGVAAGLTGYLAKGVARTTPAAGTVSDIVGFVSNGGKVDRAPIDSNTTKDGNGNIFVLTWTPRWTPFQAAYGLVAG